MPALLLQSAHRETLARANGFPGGRLPPQPPAATTVACLGPHGQCPGRRARSLFIYLCT